MSKDICRMGHPVLRKRAEVVDISEINTEDFEQLIREMKEAMAQHGGIGIAAPQIGISKQVALIDLPESNRYGEKVSLPLTIFINPKINVLTPLEQGFWEGCLSVPGLRGYVERPREVEVEYLDENGQNKKIKAEGFLATVLQHELDHLFGVLYVDRIKDMTKLVFQEEYEQFFLR